MKTSIQNQPKPSITQRKEEPRPNIWPETPNELRLQRRTACQTKLKALDISSATAWIALDLLKAVLSDTTARRSTVDYDDLKTY